MSFAQSVPMKKSKYLIAALVLVLGCTPSQSPQVNISQSKATAADTNTFQPLIKASKSKVNLKGWELTVTGVKYTEQQFQGEDNKYEAAGVWTVVSVTIKNTTGKRQRDDDAPFLLSFSTLVDSQGNKYDVKEIEYKYSADLLNKPFSPGEARSVDLLFDTPSRIKASQFLLDTDQLDDMLLNL